MYVRRRGRVETEQSYNRRVRSRRSAVVLVALIISVAMSLGAETAPGTIAGSGGTLRSAAAVDVDTLDPALATSALTWAIEYGTCATLMAFADAPAPDGYTVRPEAAASLPEVSRDGRTYLFTVRSGLRFSDGSPLTPANFAHALGRVLSPAMRSLGASFFSDVSHVSARGHRLRIELSKPSGDLLTRLALPFACPVPLGFPIDPAGVPLMVGSGPYYVARYVRDSLLQVERNRYYRGARPHRIDHLVMTVNNDVDSDISAVEQGQADVLGAELPFDYRDSLAQRYGVNKSQLFRIRGTVIYFLALNTSRPLFRANVALRKAVNLALNRTEIVKTGPGWPLSQTPTDQILPRSVPGWVDHRLYPLAQPNLKLARSLATGNLRGAKAVLYTSQIPFLVDEANVIARNLSQIGLQVTIAPLAPAVIDARAGTPGAPYDMVLTRYMVQYPDPAEVIIRLLAGENARRPAANTNFAYFDSPTYNRQMAAADRLAGPGRLRAFAALDANIMRNAAPWAPLYEGSSWLFVSKRVGCLQLHPVFRLDYAAVCLR
jgi:ABC-type transport system substrate-binding protein